MGGQSGASVLVTMCGKTVDISWLCEKGHSVTYILPVSTYEGEGSW